MSEIFTPPYVYKPNLAKRILATILDYGFYLAFMFAYVRAFGNENSDGSISVEGLKGLPVFLVWFIYFVLVEALYGGTLFHQAFNLKVVTIRRQKISFGQALKRHLLDPIDFFFWGIPAIIAIKNTDHHQRIGDMWAKTVVVNRKDPEQYSTS